MNERTVPAAAPDPPPPAKARAPAPVPWPQVAGRDREFPPAALEIPETPPAPPPAAIMLTICAFFAAAVRDRQGARRSLANAAASANAANNSASGAPGRQPNFVLPVTLSLDSSSMRIDNVSIPLTPGMTATVEIKTDGRRVIDYLLSPLAKVASESMRER